MTARDFTIRQISDYYGIPGLKIGMKVMIKGITGKVSGVGDSGLKIKLDSENKSIHCHPTWDMVYFDDNDNIIKDFRKTKGKEKS